MKNSSSSESEYDSGGAEDNASDRKMPPSYSNNNKATSHNDGNSRRSSLSSSSSSSTIELVGVTPGEPEVKYVGSNKPPSSVVTPDKKKKKPESKDSKMEMKEENPKEEQFERKVTIPLTGNERIEVSISGRPSFEAAPSLATTPPRPRRPPVRNPYIKKEKTKDPTDTRVHIEFGKKMLQFRSKYYNPVTKQYRSDFWVECFGPEEYRMCDNMALNRFEEKEEQKQVKEFNRYQEKNRKRKSPNMAMTITVAEPKNNNEEGDKKKKSKS